MQRSVLQKEMPEKLKGKIICCQTSSAVRSRELGDNERARQEARIDTNEMRVLRWMCGVTKKDKTRNEYIKETTRVAEVSKI